MGCGSGAGVELSKYDKYVQTFEITINREIVQYAPALHKPLLQKGVIALIADKIEKENKDKINALDDKTYQQELNKIPEHVAALKEKFNPNFIKYLLEMYRMQEEFLATVPADKRDGIRKKIMETYEAAFTYGLPHLAKLDEKQLQESFKGTIYVTYNLEQLKKSFANL